jgi:ADP-ribose pyrophosphatase
MAMSNFVPDRNNGKWIESINIPKGARDDNESIDICALREAQEELGLNITKSKVSLLCNVDPDNGVISSRHPVFLVEIFTAEKSFKKDADDIVDVLWLTPQEIDEKIKNQEIFDSFTMCAVLHAKLNHFL